MKLSPWSFTWNESEMYDPCIKEGGLLTKYIIPS